MIDLNLNFDELEHMNLDDAKELVSHFDLEEDRWELNGTMYRVEKIKDFNFTDSFSHENGWMLGILCICDEYWRVKKRCDIMLKQHIEKLGMKWNYFMGMPTLEYDWKCDPFEVHRIAKKEIPPKVIPRRTIVVFEHEEE